MASLQPPYSSSSIKRKRPSMIEIPVVRMPLRVPAEDVVLGENGVDCYCEPGVAALSVKGKKKFMEDTHRIVSSANGDPNTHFFGVYDGHGGRKAADFVAERLHRNVLEMLGSCETKSDMEEAIKAGYLRTDQEFLEQDLSSGACCVTALIRGQEITISNLGDCRAILCRGEVAETLTRDHRAGQEDERKRIEEKGGFVAMHRGMWRVHGVLSISRSIGDSHLKRWITAEPETRIIALAPDMEFLILASDGLWEQVSNQEAVDVINRLYSNHKKTCEDEDKDGNIEEYGLVSVSPSSKLRRISLKQPMGSSRSPGCRKLNDNRKDVEEDSQNEFDSPPAKKRRISMVKRLKTRIERTNKENMGSNDGLVAACKELVNLAVSNQEAVDVINRLYSNHKKTCEDEDKDGNVEEYGLVSVSPSSKLRRISLKQPMGSSRSPGCRKLNDNRKDVEEDSQNEFDSPPAKKRRISMVKHLKTRIERTNKENVGSNDGLVAACKELVNLAVSRGSMDDITVMIIDLHHLR